MNAERQPVARREGDSTGLSWRPIGAVALALLAIWALGLWYFSPWVAHNDFALLRMRLERALGGEIQLVGPYTRIGAFHPGPVIDWTFVGPYWLSGRRAAALPATAIIWNLVWMVVAIRWVLGDRSRTAAITTAVGFVLIVIAMRNQLDSAWNPHLPVIAMFVALVATALALSGARGAWAVAIIAASAAAQPHASALIVATLVGLMVIVAERRNGAPWWRVPVLGVALWIGPILDLGRDANLVDLATAGDEGGRLGLSTALGHVSRLLWPPTIFGMDAIEPNTSVLTGWSRLLVVIVFAVLLAGVIRLRGRVRHMATVALVGLIGAIVTIAAFVRPVFGYSHGAMQAVAVFALVVAGATAFELIADIRRESPNAASETDTRSTRPGDHLPLRASMAALIVVTVIVAVATDGPHDHESEARRALGLEAAVVEVLDTHDDWTSIRLIDAQLAGANFSAELADILIRNDRDPRSNHPSLFLDPPSADMPAFVAAMGASRGCLLGAGAAPIADGIVAPIAAPVSIFVLARTGDEPFAGCGIS